MPPAQPPHGPDRVDLLSADALPPARGRARWRIPTIADGLALRMDNFQLLRFLAAANVIYHHGYQIAAGGGPPEFFSWVGLREGTPHLDVDLFFVMSGFLVTGAFLRTPDVIRFLWSRLLRILPGYAWCMLLTAFVVGPLFTERWASAYLQDPGTSGYVARNLRLAPDLAWTLPGVFAGNPRTDHVNMAIWTMPALVRLYAWVAALGFLGILSLRRRLNVVLAGLLVLVVGYGMTLPLLAPPEYARLSAMFATGAFCFVNRSWLPTHGGVLIALAATTFLARDTPAFLGLFAATEVLFVFWFAYRLRWHGFNRLPDLSYGIYLWGFVAQQMIAAVAGSLSPIANAACGLAVATALAAASWYLVEQPALRMKRLPPAWTRRASGWFRRGPRLEAP